MQSSSNFWIRRDSRPNFLGERHASFLLSRIDFLVVLHCLVVSLLRHTPSIFTDCDLSSDGSNAYLLRNPLSREAEKPRYKACLHLKTAEGIRKNLITTYNQDHVVACDEKFPSHRETLTLRLTMKNFEVWQNYVSRNFVLNVSQILLSIIPSRTITSLLSKCIYGYILDIGFCQGYMYIKHWLSYLFFSCYRTGGVGFPLGLLSAFLIPLCNSYTNPISVFFFALDGPLLSSRK